MVDHCQQRGRDLGNVDLSALPGDYAQSVRACLPQIDEALERAGRTHTLQDVVDMIAAGRAHLWCGERSAIVTEIVTYPRMRELNVWLAGGDMRELLTMRESVTQFAKRLGAKRLTLTGRKGWAKLFPEAREVRRLVLEI